MRKDLLTNTMQPKKELVRVVVDKDKNISVMLDLRLQKWMILWIILRIIASLQNLIRRLAGDSSVLRKYLARAPQSSPTTGQKNRAV